MRKHIMMAVPVLFILFTGCGKTGLEPEQDKRTEQVGNCSVTETTEGAEIKCPDGTAVIIRNGNNGKDGTDGQNGTDGTDGTNGTNGKDGIDGTDGTDGADGQDGMDGVDGQDGKRGKNGKNINKPLYVGYFCSRTIIEAGDQVYIINNGLVPLTNKWYHVSNSCKVRYKNGKVEQGT